MLVVEEVGAAQEKRALEARCAVDRHECPGVLRLGFEHRHGRCQWRAALPALDDARVARFRHRSRPDIGADIDRVGIDPLDQRLRLGQRETAFNEALLDGIELAHHVRIRATARQRDQAEPTLRPQALRATPDPVFAFAAAERIEIEHRLPGRRGLLVVGQRGAPPQAARLGFVLPEVVEPVAAPRDVGNAVLRVQHRQHPLVRDRVRGLGFEQRLRFGIARTHPGERLIALDLFEPEERVVCGDRVHAVATSAWVSGWRRM